VEVSHSTRSTVRVVGDTLRLMGDLFRMRHWAATGVYEARETDELVATGDLLA
jgi:hypothetical protein